MSAGNAPRFLFGKGELLACQYSVEEPLGKGGMGEVYEVIDIRAKKRLALKVLSVPRSIDNYESLVLRFQREEEIAAELRERFSTHPGSANVLTSLGSGLLSDGRPYLLMDRVQGITLYRYLYGYDDEHGNHVPGHGRMHPLSAACRFLAQLFRGLAYMHGKGIVHRDIKEANVFIEIPTGGSPGEVLPIRALIADFGIGWLIGSDEPALTEHGFRPGTKAYMPREQLLALEPPSRATDIYSAAILAFKVITGRSPYASFGPDDEVWKLILTNDPPVADSLSSFLPAIYGDIVDEMAEVMALCLSHDHRKRFAADWIADQFERWADVAAHVEATQPVETINATWQNIPEAVTTSLEEDQRRAAARGASAAAPKEPSEFFVEPASARESAAERPEEKPLPSTELELGGAAPKGTQPLPLSQRLVPFAKRWIPALRGEPSPPPQKPGSPPTKPSATGTAPMARGDSQAVTPAGEARPPTPSPARASASRPASASASMPRVQRAPDPEAARRIAAAKVELMMGKPVEKVEGRNLWQEEQEKFNRTWKGPSTSSAGTEVDTPLPTRRRERIRMIVFAAVAVVGVLLLGIGVGERLSASSAKGENPVPSASVTSAPTPPAPVVSAPALIPAPSAASYMPADPVAPPPQAPASAPAPESTAAAPVAPPKEKPAAPAAAPDPFIETPPPELTKAERASTAPRPAKPRKVRSTLDVPSGL